MTPRLLSTAEVAALLRVTPGAVATAVRRGRGPVPYGRGGRGRADGARKLGGFNDLRNSLPNTLACFRHMPILKTMTNTTNTYSAGWDDAVAEMRADRWTRETARQFIANASKTRDEYSRGFDAAVNAYGSGVLLIGIAEQLAP